MEPTIARVAHRSLYDTTSLLHRLHAHFELIDIVQGVEYTENIDTVLLRLLTEVVDSVVR